ncbi:MAG: YdjY domain-containing protein [Pirellulales bacterium]
MMPQFIRLLLALLLAAYAASMNLGAVRADEAEKTKKEETPAPKQDTAKQDTAKQDTAKQDAPIQDAPMQDPPGFRRISKEHAVWINTERKMVVVDGKVCLRQGPLEMFACPRKSKEHESIVAVSSDAMTIHAGLLAVGGKSGNPVRFAPEYKAATGSKVDIMVLWTDKDGKRQQMPAQKWIRHTQTKKELEYSWVFAGSAFFVDEETKQRHYQAEAGDLVCVSNFPTATLDLPVESSQANAQLEFEAFTENIPPVGTPVRIAFLVRSESAETKKAD